MSILQAVLDRVTPYWLRINPLCCLCLAPVKKGKIAICEDCKADLPWITQGCTCCALPIPHQGLCGQCIKQPPFYHRIVAPWRYDFPVAQLITQFKHQQQWPLGRVLTELLAIDLQNKYNTGLTKPDYLVAVPLSKARFKQRGFNQAIMIAEWLSKQLGIATNHRCIERIIDTPAQQQLSAKERRQNLKNAFAIRTPSVIKGAYIAIIDDVVTTGSTANTLAKLLCKAGAKQVDIYCLARTPYTFK